MAQTRLVRVSLSAPRETPKCRFMRWAAIAAALRKAGFKVVDIYKPRELLGLTAMEKLVGKKRFDRLRGGALCAYQLVFAKSLVIYFVIYFAVFSIFLTRDSDT